MPRMCNIKHTHHTHHTHSQTAYCAGGDPCLQSGTRRSCWRLALVRPEKVLMHHSGETLHHHVEDMTSDFNEEQVTVQKHTT